MDLLGGKYATFTYSFSPTRAIQNMNPVWVQSTLCCLAPAQPKNSKNATTQSRERGVTGGGSVFLPSLDFLGT